MNKSQRTSLMTKHLRVGARAANIINEYRRV